MIIPRTTRMNVMSEVTKYAIQTIRTALYMDHLRGMNKYPSNANMAHHSTSQSLKL